MANRHPPMPALFGSVHEDTRAMEDESVSGDYDESRAIFPASETSIQTRTKTITHRIQWTIDGRTLEIACLAPKAEARGVISEYIQRNNREFKLELCASGWRNSQDGFAALYMTVKDDGEPFVARYRVHAESVSRTSSIRHDFQLGVGFPSFCEQSMLTGLSADQRITFFVTVEEFIRNSHVTTPRSGQITPEERLKFLSTSMDKMYENRLHTDVTLICQEQRIPAHKAVLASCSPVFRAMFEHPFMERSNEVLLSDFSPQTVRAMIRFLYTCELDDDEDDDCPMESEYEEELADDDFSDEEKKIKLIEKTSLPSNATVRVMCIPQSDINNEETLCETTDCAIDVVNDSDMHFFNLFRFAEMYGMTTLAVACCRKMHESIGVNNICKLLIPLSRYSHVQEFDGIQESLWKYFKEHFRDIKKTNGFQILLQQHPTVVCDILDNLMLM